MNLSIARPVQFSGRTQRNNDDLKAFNPGDAAVLTTSFVTEAGVSERHQAVTIIDIKAHEGKTVNGLTVPEGVEGKYMSDTVDLVQYKTEDGREHEQLYGMYLQGDDVMNALQRGYRCMNKLDEDGSPINAKYTYTRGQIEKQFRSVPAFIKAVQEKQVDDRKTIASLQAAYHDAATQVRALSNAVQSGIAAGMQTGIVEAIRTALTAQKPAEEAADAAPASDD